MPELDDSQGDPDPDTGEPPSPLDVDISFARFDEVANDDPSPIGPDGSGGRVGELISILQVKAQEADRLAGETGRAEPAEMEDWDRRLGNATSMLQHARRATALRSRTSAGLSLMRLGLVPEALNPPAVERSPGEELVVHANRLFKWAAGGERPLYSAVHEQVDGAVRS